MIKSYEIDVDGFCSLECQPWQIKCKSNANQVDGLRDRLLDLVKKLDGFLELGLLPQCKCKGLKHCKCTSKILLAFSRFPKH